MKLSDTDKRILSYLTLQADLSFVDVAKALNVKEHSVRRTIKKLKDNDLIQTIPIINPYALGYTEYQILFSIESPGEAARTALVDALIADERVHYISELGGEYQLDAVVYTKSVHELVLFFDALYAKAPTLELRRYIMTTVSTTEYSAKYLGCNQFANKSLYYGPVDEISVIDETDHKILKWLGNNEFSSVAHVARELKISESTMAHRLDALRKRNILVRFAFGIRTLALGIHNFLVLLKLSQVTPEIRSKLALISLDHQNISYIAEKIGSWDYTLGIKTDDPRSISTIIQNLKFQLGDKLVKAVPIPRYEQLKINFYPFQSVES